MLYLDLTGEQRAELEAVSRQAVGRVALCAQMVLLSDCGHSVPQFAAIHGCGGLDDLPRSGRPPRERLARQSVDAQASQSPRRAGLVQACWTVALLPAFLAARFGLLRARATVRRHLQAGGWRWRRPRLAPASALPAKRDPATASKVAALRAALRAAARGTRRVRFLDACALHLLPVLRSCWQKGPRLRVPTPGTNAKRAFFGARDATSGACHVADHDRKLAVHCVAVLQRLADRYPAARLTLAMDNVAMHDAKVVRVWLAAHPRVTVPSTPPTTPTPPSASGAC